MLHATLRLARAFLRLNSGRSVRTSSGRRLVGVPTPVAASSIADHRTRFAPNTMSKIVAQWTEGDKRYVLQEHPLVSEFAEGASVDKEEVRGTSPLC